MWGLAEQLEEEWPPQRLSPLRTALPKPRRPAYDQTHSYFPEILFAYGRCDAAYKTCPVGDIEAFEAKL
jgi:hypothetical protein